MYRLVFLDIGNFQFFLVRFSSIDFCLTANYLWWLYYVELSFLCCYAYGMEILKHNWNLFPRFREKWMNKKGSKINIQEIFVSEKNFPNFIIFLRLKNWEYAWSFFTEGTFLHELRKNTFFNFWKRQLMRLIIHHHINQVITISNYLTHVNFALA